MQEFFYFILLGALKSLKYFAVAFVISTLFQTAKDRERPNTFRGKIGPLVSMSFIFLFIAWIASDQLGTSQECEPIEGWGAQNCIVTEERIPDKKEKSVYFWSVFLIMAAPYGYGLWQKRKTDYTSENTA
jgi:hypothetical protein